MKNPAQCRVFYDWSMTAYGRHLLHATTRVEGPVRICKLPFPKRDFLQYDVPESANSRH